MKRLLWTLLIILPLGLFGQIRPVWLDLESRDSYYPENLYYTGIAYGSMSGNFDDDTKRTVDAAKLEALSSLLASVDHTAWFDAVSQEFSTDNGVDEKFISIFRSRTKMDVVFKDIPDLHSDTYVEGNRITAFAYVLKSDLAAYYDKSIFLLLTQVETILDNADQLVSQGQKIRARDLAKSAVEKMAALENAQRVMVAVDKSSDVHTERISLISKRLVPMLAKLKNGATVYLECNTKLGGRDYPELRNQIKGEISKLGVNFSENRSGADWYVHIDVYTVRENEINGNSYVWVDGSLAVKNGVTGLMIYKEALSGLSSDPDLLKGGFTNPITRDVCGSCQAIRDACKKVAKIVAPKIVEIINQ